MPGNTVRYTLSYYIYTQMTIGYLGLARMVKHGS